MGTVLEEPSPVEITALAARGFPGARLLSPVSETGTTGTLVNIYCRMRTQDEMAGTGEFENNEAMASPLSLERLLETWTESLERTVAGGGGGGPLEKSTIDDDFVYNTSRTDLIPVVSRSAKGPGYGLQQRTPPGDYASKRHGSDSPVSRHGDDPRSSTRAAVPSSVHDASFSTFATATAQQAGSPVLTASLLRGHDTVDCSSQFPPASMDRAVQTSFTFSESQLSLTECKAQQTSVIAVAVTNLRGAAPPLDNTPAGHSYTSTTDNNKMVLSSHPLNRPLPDLSFLKKPANRGTLRCDDGEPAPPKADDSSRSALSTETQPRPSAGKHPAAADEVEEDSRTSLFQLCRRSADVKAASSSSDSRDSSPRPVVYRNRSRSSDSTSTYSVCSTSSSGIDPGFYDSSGSGGGVGSGTRTPRMSRIFDDGAKTPPVAATETQKNPPKPPRMHAASSESHLPVKDSDLQTTLRKAVDLQTTLREVVKSGSWSDAGTAIGGLCTACNSRIVSGGGSGDATKALVSSHPIYFRREVPCETDNLKLIEYLHVSPTHGRTRRTPESPATGLARKSVADPHHQLVTRHSSPRLLQRSKDHVTLRGSQAQLAKPAKSILVRRRQRNQAKHRSWSNPACEMDDLGPRHGYLPSYLVGGDRRPVSLPDENLLLQTQSGVAEDYHIGGAGGGGGSLPQPRPPQRWKSQTCVSGDEPDAGDATVIPADIVEETEAAPENEEDPDCDYERFKAKKSVSFSEKIFYHSTSATASPLDSPRCPQVALLEATPENPAAPATKKSVECKTLIDESKFKADPDDTDMPPTDFMVSPNLSPSSSLSGSDVTLSTDILHKRELVFDVMRAVEVLVKYFSQTRDPTKKVQLGSTTESSEIGHLVLEHLCPAIHAVVLDGLKPYVSSLFGKVKNSACKVMEDSAELGQPNELIQGLVKSLKSLKFLNTPWLFFNAFIFGLLNYKALDFWLTCIHNHKPLLARHYTSSSFIHLSNSAAHRLFLDMITSLQPLAQMPFRLEYVFETRMLERRQQDQLAEYLLDRHVSRSVETYIEGQQFLTQLENLSSSQLALQQDEMLSAAVSESKLKQRTRQLWQRTQRHIVEKLSASKERLATESTTLIRSVTRAAANEGTTLMRSVTRAAANEGTTLMRSVTRATATSKKPRPMSLPGTFQVDDLKYANPPACVSSVRSLAPMESLELLGGSGDASCLAESSSGSESDGGFFLRLTKQLRDMHLRDRVYRRGGATDYSFDDLGQQKPGVGGSDSVEEKARGKGAPNDTTSKSDATVRQLTVKSENSREESANCALQSDSCSEVQTDFEKARLRNSRPSQSPAVPASLAAAAVPSSHRPASSETVGTLGSRAVHLANGGGQSRRSPLPSSMTAPQTVSSALDESVTKKRWSDFGTRLVNIFDRLLLSDTMATATTGSASSSSVVKCQSMGQINGGAVGERSGGGGSKRRPLSTSTQFIKAHSLDSPAPGSQAKNAMVEPVSRNPRSARALCHYIAADNQQLSFEKGSSMVILQDRDIDWKLCRLGDSEGLVHSACLRLDEIPQGKVPQ